MGGAECLRRDQEAGATPAAGRARPIAHRRRDGGHPIGPAGCKRGEMMDDQHSDTSSKALGQR
jgi:hypothetical protein